MTVRRRKTEKLVPILLTAQKVLKSVQKLSFCYLCGQGFGPRHETNRDHVPPSGLFTLVDRDQPLILPTHCRCNAIRSQEDQAIGQLIGLLHGRPVHPTHNKLHFIVGQFDNGSPALALSDFDVKEVLRRWIRGFHAALYRQYLPVDTLFGTYPPLPEARCVAGEVVFVPMPEAIPKFVEELKRNRAVGNLDRIVCRNGKCRYDCIWSQADDGKWICIYCLNLYNWIQLGDVHNFPSRGCVGFYRQPSGGVPRDASTATRLIFELKNAFPFDPFVG